MQTHERRLIFEHVSKHDTLGEARALKRAAEEYAATRKTVRMYPTKLGKAKPYRLALRWCYGWVKGGWQSDGQRFIHEAARRSGVALNGDAALRVAHEEKQEIVS